VKCIQMSTECSHAIILQTTYHRGNTAERYIKEYLVPAGPCKRKKGEEQNNMNNKNKITLF